MRPVIPVIALIIGLALPVWADSLSDLRTSAKQGDPEAQFFLGTLYRDGQGTEKNLVKTLTWWTKAAEQGYLDAQFALGNIYSGGFGVQRNYVLSYMWYDIAAAQTKAVRLAPVASSNRDALVARMTTTEISEARQMSADWIARHRQ